MKPLRPRTIVAMGLAGTFCAMAVPVAIQDPTVYGLIDAIRTGLLFTVPLGIPVFGAMAWVTRYSEKEPMGDAVSLNRYYRRLERNLSVVGMGALGCLAGSWVMLWALQTAAPRPGVCFILCVLCSAVSSLVILAMAVAKVGVLRRLSARR
jgi:hypothetical protein